MSGKKEKIATKKALPLEALWRVCLACLNAGPLLAQQASHTADAPLLPASLQSFLRWVGLEKGLLPLLRERIDHDAAKSTFFVEDFDPSTIDFCFSLMAQMQKSSHINLNSLTRWGSYSASQTASEALTLLTHWQHQFRLAHDLVGMARNIALIQEQIFQHPKAFHLHSDGQMLMAVWEGQAKDNFSTHAPKHLLDLEKLPHSILLNRRDNHNAQLAAIWPLRAPVSSTGLLRCLIILEPTSAEKISQPLPKVG